MTLLLLISSKIFFLPLKKKLSNLHKLWDLHSLGIKEKDKVHENVIDQVHYTGERYSVGLQWRVGHGPIPLNYANSKARLKSQLRKLGQPPES